MDARTTALSALIACRRQAAWSDGVLKEYIARDALDGRDAAFASRLCYGVLQNRMLLDFYLAQKVKGACSKLQPVVLDILRLGAYQILFCDRVPDAAAVSEAVEQAKRYANRAAAGLVNGVLRTLSREKDTLRQPDDLATRYSHPQPLVELLGHNAVHRVGLPDEQRVDLSGEPGAQRLIDSVNFDDEESVNWFHKTLRRMGIIDRLREAGAKEGDTIVFADMEFDFVE